MDMFYFEIDEAGEMYVFEKNTAFNRFGTEFMKKRLESTNEANDLFNKIFLNGSYGYDFKKDEKFTNCQFLSKNQTYSKSITTKFVNTNPLLVELKDEKGNIVREAQFQVQMKKRTFSYDTCIDEGFLG
jgi:hypothetical protein